MCQEFLDADQSISSIDLKDTSGCFTDWVCKDLEAISFRFTPGKAYARLRRRIDENHRRNPIFPEVLCTQLCRLEKLGKLRLAMEVYLGHDERQQQDEEEEEEDDPHLTMEKALYNIQGSLKNIRMLELPNLDGFFDSSARDKHPLMDLVISKDIRNDQDHFT
ncbi:hypothetical protein BG004_006948 [Podila humilis]|nr:hypothetical protein BG004_006948 [Podila humilis]